MWNRALEVHSGYEEQELEDVVRTLNALHAGLEASGLLALYKKYDRHTYGRVSRLVATRASDLRFLSGSHRIQSLEEDLDEMLYMDGVGKSCVPQHAIIVMINWHRLIN